MLIVFVTRMKEKKKINHWGFSSFLSLIQNEKLHHNETKLDGDKTIRIVRVLQNATKYTHSLYGNDVRTAYQMMIRVLQYESQQQGFDLAATRDVEFNEVREILYTVLSLYSSP